MSERPYTIEFDITDDSNVEFDILNDANAEFNVSDPVIDTGTKNYERLVNKPQINGREIIGNKTVAYYLQDGLIIDGGTAEGATD